jgi:hypothetical protein
MAFSYDPVDIGPRRIMLSHIRTEDLTTDIHIEPSPMRAVRRPKIKRGVSARCYRTQYSKCSGCGSPLHNRASTVLVVGR